MITARYDTSHERYIISVEGHANHGKEGEDTVCAAASILAFALFRTLTGFDKKGALESFYHSVEKGNCQFDFTVDTSFSVEVSAAVDALFEGFFLLEENFPECVRVV